MTRAYRTYRWDDWLLGPADVDGQHREVLVRGEDYDCSQSAMSQQVRTAARQRRLLVSITDMDDRLVVITRPMPPARPEPSYVPANEAKAMRDEDAEFRSRERNA